ncbi:MAG: peptidase S1 [Bacteroidota bacterium]
MRIPLLLLALLVAAPLASAQDISAVPTYGDVRLDEGFMPDPHTTDLTAGGSVEVSIPGCSYGHVAEAPDVDFYYTSSGGSDLFIYAVSGDDTTILVNTPDGSWTCDDDSYGDGDPIAVIRNAPAGLYNIWVGTYSDGLSDARLMISEVDPR